MDMMRLVLVIPQLASHLVLNCFYQSLTRKNRIGEKTMKMMKAICTATVLSLTLSVSVFAGDISSPGAPVTCEIGTPCPVSSGAPTVSTDALGTLADFLLALVSTF